MTEQGWRDAVLKCSTDSVMLDLAVRLLVEQDKAKHELQRKGYGCMGTSLVRCVAEVPEVQS